MGLHFSSHLSTVLKEMEETVEGHAEVGRPFTSVPSTLMAAKSLASRFNCVRTSAWVFGPEIRIFQQRAHRTTVSAAYRTLPLAMTKLLPALRVAVLPA